MCHSQQSVQEMSGLRATSVEEAVATLYLLIVLKTDPEHDLHQKMSPVDSLQQSDVCKARFAGLPCATYGL